MSSKTQPVVSIYDSKATLYSPPQVFPNLAEVIRFFTNMKSNPQAGGHPWNRFPADFQPFHIADWNEELATITMLSHPVGLGTLDSTSFGPAPSAEDFGNLARFPVTDREADQVAASS